MFGDEQVEHLQVVRAVDHATLGKKFVLGQPIRLSAATPIDNKPAPTRGEHSVDILKEMGLSEEAVAHLQREQVF